MYYSLLSLKPSQPSIYEFLTVNSFHLDTEYSFGHTTRSRLLLRIYHLYATIYVCWQNTHFRVARSRVISIWILQFSRPSLQIFANFNYIFIKTNIMFFVLGKAFFQVFHGRENAIFSLNESIKMKLNYSPPAAISQYTGKGFSSSVSIRDVLCNGQFWCGG